MASRKYRIDMILSLPTGKRERVGRTFYIRAPTGYMALERLVRLLDSILDILPAPGHRKTPRTRSENQQ